MCIRDRFSDDLDYAGTYDMWQCNFSAPGADYGVQSETVDLDFVMKPFKFTGVSACNMMADIMLFSRFSISLLLASRCSSVRVVSDMDS